MHPTVPVPLYPTLHQYRVRPEVTIMTLNKLYNIPYYDTL